MKENVFDNPVELRSAVAQPRFDDQRVLQRAQRVVPLDEIRTKLRLRRIGFLGGAFAIAIVLGAASALVAVHIQRAGANGTAQIQLTTNTQPETNTTETETNTTETETAATQAEPQMEPASLVEDEAPMQPEVKPETTLKKQTPPADRPRVVAREFEPLEPRKREGDPNEEEQLEQIRESVLYDRWQERRERRAERRERRRNRNRGGDRDLSNVDELFEGPRRRERPRY
jgi:outer membrane biosynthesis protein TonB